MPALSASKLLSPKNERVYELRSYESGSYKIYRNKVHMFNEGGEIDLFDRLGFNAVFYGDVIYGAKMPNLMYMTSFENKKARDEHWAAFGKDPAWKTLVWIQGGTFQMGTNDPAFTDAQPMHKVTVNSQPLKGQFWIKVKIFFGSSKFWMI